MKRIWMVAIVFVLLVLLAACTTTAEQPVEEESGNASQEIPTEEAAQEEPVQDELPEEPVQEESAASARAVRIGVLNPTSGSLAANGEDVNAGIKLYFDSINYTVNGVAVELSYADTAGNPEQALEQTRRLVEQGNVDFLLGVVSSSVVVPLADFADENQVPLIVAVAGGTPVITGPDRSPYVFRAGITTNQLEAPFGWYVVTEMGHQKATTYAWDFAAGKSRAETFGNAFSAAGGEVVAQNYAPLDTSDFGPFIAQLNRDEIDLVYAFFAGPGAIAFVKQMAEFGITPELQLVGPGFLTEAEILPEMGRSAVGIVSATHYTPAADNAANQRFIELFQASREGLPGTYIESGYLAALIAASAIEAVGGDMSDTQTFLDALQSLEVEGPGGTFSFDERGQGLRNVYIVEVVEDENGNIVHELLDEIEDVSQDWSAP